MGLTRILTIALYVLLGILILFTLRQANVLGARKGTSKAKVDVKKEKDIAKARNKRLKILAFFRKVCNEFGRPPRLAKKEKYDFLIERIGLEVKYVGRNISSEEIIGLFKILKVFFCFLGVFIVILHGSKLFLLFFLILFIDTIFEAIMEAEVAEEDKEIEEDFPDLFILLYSRLIRGAAIRLSPTLDEYIRSMDTLYGEHTHKGIHKFIMTLRKYIELYGDDSMALHKMRDIYKSATVINFLNLAIQALRGVDNKDKLMAFKMELSQKKLDAMTKKANQMVEKGNRAIMLIYVILFEFVLLSWAAKIGGSFAGFADMLKSLN